MAVFKKIALTVAFALLVCVLFYKTIFHFLIISYFKTQGISVSFELQKLATDKLILQNIYIEEKTFIRRFELSTSHFWQKPLQIKKLYLDADNIDLQSIMKVFAKIKGKTQTPSAQQSQNPKIIFSDVLKHCQQINSLPFSLQIDAVTWADTKIPIHLKTTKINKQVHLLWSAPAQTSGSVYLQCEPDAIFLQAPEIIANIQNIKDADLSIEKLKFQFQNAFIKWEKNSSLQSAFPGEFEIVKTQNKIKQSLHLPTIVLSTQSHLDQPKKIEVRLLAKKISFVPDKNKTIHIPILENLAHVDLDSIALNTHGRLSLQNLSIQDDKKSPFLQGLNGITHYQASRDDYKMKINLTDKNRLLQIKNFSITGSIPDQDHKIFFKSQETLVSLKTEIVDLIPSLKPYIQHLSGQLNLSGNVAYKNKTLQGSIHLIGQDISYQSEYGSFEGVSFSHSVNSFKTWASLPKQNLQVKKVNIGPGIENLKIIYQVLNLKKINVQSLFFNIEQASLHAENFRLNLFQKRVENLILKISNLDLEKVLALGLKSTVKAKGQLNGQIGVHFHTHRPTLSGNLADSQPGHIQYRTGKLQASSLSISDTPMDILNNYLYDFYYKNIAIQISTDEKYDMKMTLSAWGHNPNYLNGKPLKLNVNLEQNLLAAMQSIMLTYDLPSRLKEKIEKVEQ
jgi:hypothetical protein